MKKFQEFRFDPRTCRTQLNELKAHLENHDNLNERKDVLAFFREREHLSAYIGSYSFNLNDFDRLAFEYDLFGDFKADLAIGDSRHGSYCFVEFEGASPTSIFKSESARATRIWSSKFEQGYSQIVDWFWKLWDMERTSEFMSRFGVKQIRY